MAMKPHGKSIVSSDYDEKVVFFNISRWVTTKLSCNFGSSISGRLGTHKRRRSSVWRCYSSMRRELLFKDSFPRGCDLKGDLYDVVGHMKLVNGQSIVEAPVLDEVEIAKARRVMIHIQSHDGPVMKLYLWDQAARDFCKKFKSYESTPTVLLVTTVNTEDSRRYSCLDLNVLFACVYGLRCPTYHRLLQLVGV
ncbi:BnaC05g32650D [Brassica napus]|uniref:BnaC05g32650D protein n=1 Tax=Brassica napus TaxID=3708 RepID=A0A078GGV2_BRANA|nr:BnaC05g32650D [Brassica napus]